MMKPRYWPAVLYGLAGLGAFIIADHLYLRINGVLPALKDLWAPAALVPMICGCGITLGAGGAAMSRRITAAALCGGLTGIFHTILAAGVAYGIFRGINDITINGLWKIFIFTIFSIIGVILTELMLPEPDNNRLKLKHKEVRHV
jgi:hypothetical protein